MALRRKNCSNDANHLNHNNQRIIQLTRTKNGYGFTLSGEMPCMLTQVKGYAYASGLRSGDYLISVNGQNVSQLSHDQVVRLITCSSGTLKLKIAQNCNYYSSNSDDSEFDRKDHVQRPRYPYRHRKSCHNNTDAKENSFSIHPNHHHFHHENKGPNDERMRKKHINTLGTRSNEGLLDLLLQQRLSQIQNNSSDSDTQPNQDNDDQHLNPNHIENSPETTPLNGTNIKSSPTSQQTLNSLFTHEHVNHIVSNSLQTVLNNNQWPTDPTEDLHSRALLRAIIGYLGTIEMPKHSNIDSLVIKNCIRRIRADNKLQTTVLLAVYPESIILANIQGQLIAQFIAQNITSCGVCADDQSYFALITTVHCQNNSQTDQQQQSSYSCHVFMTRPSAHQMHDRIAKSFRIRCTLDPVTSNCLEFPESSDPILRVIVGLYRQKLGCAPPALAVVNVTHSSSNSDSGIHDNNTSDHISTNVSFIQNDSSYNTQQLEAQLNPIRIRQTVDKYFKLKQDSNLTNIDDTIAPEQSSHESSNECIDSNADGQTFHFSHNNANSAKLKNQAQICRTTDSSSLHTNRTISHNINNCIVDKIQNTDNHIDTQIASQHLNLSTIDPDHQFDHTQHTESPVYQPKAIPITASSESWIKPATLSKENLELNNEITSSYDCDTKSSMSLEGMAPMSDTVSASASVISERPIDVGWVGGWAQHFEKLLSDQVGLNVFAQFLKKEFSYENLQFWISCQQFKKLTNQEQMRREAKNLFDRHLSVGAPEAVNVDSHARLVAQKGLDEPSPQLFAKAEKQIFNLMKFDCYQRFLKSHIYKECLSLELQGKPLPYQNSDHQQLNHNIIDQLDATQQIKSKKRSFIPWPKIKSHKTQDKMAQKQTNPKQPIIRKLSDSLSKMKSNSKTFDDQISTSSANRSDFTGSQSSITSSEPIDKSSVAFALSKSTESINQSNFYQISGHCKRDNCRLSRVILPDRSQTVVPLTTGQTIGQMIEKLLEKRNLKYSAFDAFVTGSDKPLDPNLDLTTLGCNEIRVEQRILFQIDFPNREIIGIKARSSKLCGDVFRPLLNKYGYKLEHVVLQIANSSKCVTSKMPINLIDNQRIIVSIKDDLEEWGWDANTTRIPVALNKTTRTPDDQPISIPIIDDSLLNQESLIAPNIDIDNSPGKENHLPTKSSIYLSNSNSNSDPITDDCHSYLVAQNNISFSDDSKSEAFFRDVILSSQHIPSTNQNKFSLSPKPMARQQNCLKTAAKPTQAVSLMQPYSSQIKFSQCNLSPIEKVNSNQNLINDIDLDQTLKSMQFSNNQTLTNIESALFDQTLTPSKIAYPTNANNQQNVLLDNHVANYTPPTPVQGSQHHQTMPTLVNSHKSPVRRLSSLPPPLPPKASHLDRGAPPRPPNSKYYSAVNYSTDKNHNDNSFIRNIDQITHKTNVSFV